MAAREIRAGRAFVELTTNDDRLTRGLKRAQMRLQAFGNTVSNIGKAMAAVGATAATVLFGATKHFASAGDQLAKMAGRTGLTVEALSTLKYATEQSGASVADLENSIRRMQRTIVAAADGTQTSVDALRALGLTARDLESLSPEAQFKLIADRIATIEDPTKRTAAAFDILGRSATQLLPLMQGGAAGIEELQEAARRLGLQISTKDARMAEEFGDRLDDLFRVVKNGVFTIGAALAPALTDATKRITRIVKQSVDWVKQNSALIVNIGRTAAAVTAGGVAIFAFGKAATTAGRLIGGFIKVIGALKAAAVLLTSPLGLATAAVIALSAALIDWNSVIDSVTRRVQSVTHELMSFGQASRKTAEEIRAETEALRAKVDRLEALRTATARTTDEQVEALSIASELSDAYPTLRKEIDAVGRSAAGAAELMAKLAEAQREAAKASIDQEITQTRMEIDRLVAQNERRAAAWAKINQLREDSEGLNRLVGQTGRNFRIQKQMRIVEQNPHTHVFEINQLQQRLNELERQRRQLLAAGSFPGLPDPRILIGQVLEAANETGSRFADEFLGAIERTIKANRGVFDELAILDAQKIWDPLKRELALIDLEFGRRARDAIDTGTSPEALERLHQARRQQAVGQAIDDRIGDFFGFKRDFELIGDTLSRLGSVGTFSGAQANELVRAFEGSTKADKVEQNTRELVQLNKRTNRLLEQLDFQVR